uniref:Protein kinase domain-containing protein n=1 Tax=Oryza meridionalis TaxID=40149 RepID=A0A0E0EN40_9ORYZ
MAIHPAYTSRPMKIDNFCKRTLADFDRRQTAILPPSHLACGIVMRVASGREVMTSSSSFCCLAASLLMLLLPFFAMAAAAAGGSSSSSNSNCTTICGGISIEYPFGVEPGCYHPGFNLTCNHSYSPPRLFLGDGTVQVLEISIPQSTVRINSGRMVFNSTGNHAVNRSLEVAWPYFVAASNRIALVSCNARVDVRAAAGRNNNKTSTQLISSCTAVCPSDGVGTTTFLNIGPEGPCSGIGCCETNMLLGSSTAAYSIQVQNYLQERVVLNRTDDLVYLVDERFNYTLDMSFGDSSPEALPALLRWYINSSSACPLPASAPECRSAHSYCDSSYGKNAYICSCSDGYEGNPYVPDGCHDTDECSSGYCSYGECRNTPGSFICNCPRGYEGNPSPKDGCKARDLGLRIGLGVGGGTILLLLALSAPFISSKMKLRKMKRMKETFFRQNHGLLLERLVSQNADIGQRMIMTLQELEKATDNFDKSREIGGGGHGVVYKGILDLQVVAIKKSRIVVKREIDDFINEVAILSQVNHRNVVKLLGCCLETEVPLLVYEFISNGSLDHHLHVDGPISLPWDDRIRIALEVARALTYLHSATTIPIFHRDIKACNILLDENLISKVSDFGASRYIPVEQTEVTTAVQGTIGYLDPMYYYTGHLTDKSDVFSFGVLLIELLTRKRPMYRTDHGESLVLYFASLHRQGQVVEIIDPQVMTEGDGDQIQEVASLAATCTKLNGQDRPTMRDVEMTLENLRVKKKLASHSVKSSRYNASEITEHYMLATGQGSKEMSKEYSMEEEMLLSERYPR